MPWVRVPSLAPFPIDDCGSMIAGLALAGGASRRMRAFKPLLMLRGKPLIGHVLDRLAGECAVRAISANGDPERFAAFGCPVLPDGAFFGVGPLAGVLAGLEWAAAAGAEALLTIPADTPFVPAGGAGRLSPGPSCAATGRRVHHLVALWPVGLAGALRVFLTGRGPFAAQRFGRLIGMRAVSWDIAGDADPFGNINTRADLERLG